MKKNYQKKRRQPSRSEVSAAEAAAAASVADVMADRREGLLALAVQSGLGVMQALFNQDVDRLCGLSGKHNSDRQGYLNGRSARRSRSAADPRLAGYIASRPFRLCSSQ